MTHLPDTKPRPAVEIILRHTGHYYPAGYHYTGKHRKATQ